MRAVAGPPAGGQWDTAPGADRGAAARPSGTIRAGDHDGPRGGVHAGGGGLADTRRVLPGGRRGGRGCGRGRRRRRSYGARLLGGVRTVWTCEEGSERKPQDRVGDRLQQAERGQRPDRRPHLDIQAVRRLSAMPSTLRQGYDVRVLAVRPWGLDVLLPDGTAGLIDNTKDPHWPDGDQHAVAGTVVRAVVFGRRERPRPDERPRRRPGRPPCPAGGHGSLAAALGAGVRTTAPCRRAGQRNRPAPRGRWWSKPGRTRKVAVAVVVVNPSSASEPSIWASVFVKVRRSFWKLMKSSPGEGSSVL